MISLIITKNQGNFFDKTLNHTAQKNQVNLAKTTVPSPISSASCLGFWKKAYGRYWRGLWKFQHEGDRELFQIIDSTLTYNPEKDCLHRWPKPHLSKSLIHGFCLQKNHPLDF